MPTQTDYSVIGVAGALVEVRRRGGGWGGGWRGGAGVCVLGCAAAAGQWVVPTQARPSRPIEREGGGGGQ